MQEIFSLISEKLAAQDLLHDIPAGVVLTGGGAETNSIVQVAKEELKLPARIGKPIELTGLTSDIQKPGYATSIGLLFYGRQQGGEPVAQGFSLPSLKFGGSAGKMFGKIGDLFKSLLP
jgi:cell division protein FtsA